jgi:hypothetical protein
MSTTVITGDALALMAALNDAAKSLAGDVASLAAELAEARSGLMRPVLLTPEEASKMTGIAVSTLARYRSEGQIGGRTPAPGYVKIGEKVMYELDELLRWIREDLPHFGGRGRPRQ